MKIENQTCKNTKAEDKHQKILTVRITPRMFEWIKENEYSATKIFHQAINALGYK